ncbi:Hsp33 family molecular chaperone HslO [Hyphomonas sp.]|uniref:Hsp33 family molecular chaperone HslO n=1 Tax=Hyphomonas sp. TaxID=87 RepID=UPI00352859C2
MAMTSSDFVANFQIENRPVRGRAVRMGPASISPILHRHEYPDNLARILGEAVTLAALVGSSLKFEGRLLVQAEGDGPVKMLVGEYRSDGGIRGYARYDEEAWEKLDRLNKGAAPHMPQLFGAAGRLGLIIIQDNPAIQPYQGIVPLVKGTLAECAEDYFAQSEQVPTRIRLSLAEFERPGDPVLWVSGGMMIQRVAADEARGDTEEAWDEAQALFATITDGELADPDLPMEQLLYRLFHEQGVRMEPPQVLDDRCTCNEERLVATLQAMSDEALHDLVEEDGTLSIDCQFCGRHYTVPIEDVTGASN